MSSSSSMLQVGLGAVLFIFAELVLIMIFDPLLSTIIPMMQEMTPVYWWNYLGGGMIVWLVPMVWTVISLSAVIVLVRVLVTPGESREYENENEW